MGASDGFKVIVGGEEVIDGVLVGVSVGILVGFLEGTLVGNPEGDEVGLVDGNIDKDGDVVGFNDGIVLGNPGITRAVTIVYIIFCGTYGLAAFASVQLFNTVTLSTQKTSMPFRGTGFLRK